MVHLHLWIFKDNRSTDRLAGEGLSIGAKTYADPVNICIGERYIYSCSIFFTEWWIYMCWIVDSHWFGFVRSEYTIRTLFPRL